MWNVGLDLSNYATKAEFKNTARVDKSDFVKKSDLAKIKSDVNKLDIDKLKNAPSNLSNLKSIVVLHILVIQSKKNDYIKPINEIEKKILIMIIA